MNIILLGPPGAGKGTQAAKIIKDYQVPHISTGDIFRKNIKEGTDLGKRAKAYMDKGELVPDSLVIEIALDRLKEADCQSGFLLDGFPRTVEQAEALDVFLKDQGKALDAVLNIEVDKDLLIDRLTGRRVCKECGATYHIKNIPPKVEGICDKCQIPLYQRDDDTVETVANRIEVYRKQTTPLIDYYRKKKTLFDLDGSANLDRLFEEIVNILER